MGGRGGRHKITGGGGFGRMPDTSKFLKFPTQAEAEKWHLLNTFDPNKWQSKLTEFERKGIIDYTGHWYSEMNTYLREGRIPSAEVQAKIDGATSGLSKWILPHDIITFRGANFHWTANLLGGTEEQLRDPAFLRSKIGKTVVDKGFMSSGTHESSAWAADVEYTILNRKGISGMYVDAISRNSGEYEFLYNRDTSFVVRNIKTNRNGLSPSLCWKQGRKRKRLPEKGAM